ncbi:AsnC family protein [Nocardia sp. SC052]|uniref:AsnC family protein n=1 Tax=Nocardia sichangensis TaxID=3385975 RepID=UPI0039A10D70
MSQQTDDGRHEGHVAHLFADGMFGGSWSNGPVATTTADGRHLDPEEWQYRSQDEVVGWRVICTDLRTYEAPECWRGPVWTRVATPFEQDLDARRIYCDDPYGLDQEAIDLIMATDWKPHIGPVVELYAVGLAADEVAAAQRKLTAAVRVARDAGASWTDIGREVGISRQSAHERWAGKASAAYTEPFAGLDGGQTR